MTLKDFVLSHNRDQYRGEPDEEMAQLQVLEYLCTRHLNPPAGGNLDALLKFVQQHNLEQGLRSFVEHYE